MKCFYCGRPLTVEDDKNGMMMLCCKFPRCKMQPTSDYHDNIKDCELDIEMIKESWRNSK